MHADIQTYRHTDIQTYRHTDIQTYRHTDIQTYRHTGIQTYRHIDIQTYRHTDIQTYRHTDTQTYRHTGIQTYRHTDIQTYRQTDRQTDIQTYIHTYIQTDIHTCIHAPTYIPAYIPTYIPTYQHCSNIPTYHHHRPPGGGPEEPYHHHRPQGGDQKNYTTTTGHRGGDQKNQTILSTHTHWWGGGGVANAAPYIINSCLASARCGELMTECSRLSGAQAFCIWEMQGDQTLNSHASIGLHTVRMHHNVSALELMLLRPVTDVGFSMQTRGSNLATNLHHPPMIMEISPGHNFGVAWAIIARYFEVFRGGRPVSANRSQCRRAFQSLCLKCCGWIDVSAGGFIQEYMPTYVRNSWEHMRTYENLIKSWVPFWE